MIIRPSTGVTSAATRSTPGTRSVHVMGNIVAVVGSMMQRRATATASVILGTHDKAAIWIVIFNR